MLALLCLAWARAAWAQEKDIPVRKEEPAQRTHTLSEAEQAEQAARLREAAEGGPDVTYEQVLADPDDIELNYRYAKTQVRNGNLRSAAATLERILMVNPELPKVRLFYALVLFRLDNLDDAERELDVLRAQEMPPSLRAELETYAAEIRKRRRNTHVDLTLGAGIDYDDNRNAGTSSNQRLQLNPVTGAYSLFNLLPNASRTSDAAKTLLASAGVSHNLGYQAGHSIYGNYTYYRAEQTNLTVLNLQNHGLELGFIYHAPWATVTTDVEGGHLSLAETTYLRSRGMRARFDRPLTPRLSAFGETAYTRQIYSPLSNPPIPTGDSRTGDRLEGTVGTSYVLRPTVSLFGSFMHANQGAVAKFYAYRREAVTGGTTWLMGKGQFFLASVTVNFDRYETPDLSVSPDNRRDINYRARGTYGVPLTCLWSKLENFVVTFSYEYYQSVSHNIPNYSFTDNKVSTLLTYKWSR